MSWVSEPVLLSSSRGTGRPAGLSWRTPFVLSCCLLIATTTLLDPLDNLLRVALANSEVAEEPVQEEDEGSEIVLKVGMSAARRAHHRRPCSTGRLAPVVALPAPPPLSLRPAPAPLA